MRAERYILALLLSAVCGASAVADDAPYSIRRPDQAKPYEEMAAQELGKYLALRVRDSLTVDGLDGVTFHVGDTSLAREKGCLSASMADEQWVVKSFGRDVILNGGGTRGVHYAVYHFLEEICGVRWWSPVEEDVPPASPMAIGRLELGGRPAFRLRTVHQGSEYDAQFLFKQRLFSHRVRLNALALIDPKYGGCMRYGSPGPHHTFDKYMPIEHMKDHPEWFSMDKSGKRTGGQFGGQVCFTNPEAREFFKKRLRGFIEEDRRKFAERGERPPTIYDISENDNYTYCSCTNCMAARERWNLSGLLVDFINDIASSVRESYPDVIVNTFAYHGTEEPPKGGVRAADNVMVRLCNTRSSLCTSKLEPGNTVFFDLLRKWAKVAKHISVWDYAIVFGVSELNGVPLPSEFHYAEYFRECLKNGVYGYFWQQEVMSCSDMWELKFFLKTKLMEDPFLDGDALISRFMREYYGDAGSHVLAYRRLIDGARRAKNGRVGWFPTLEDFDWIDAKTVAASYEKLAAAERATGGREPFLSRVRRARIGIDRLVCIRSRVGGKDGAYYSSVAGEAEKRIRTILPKWMAHCHEDRKRIDNEVVSIVGLPPPARFAGRKIYDFPAQFISINSPVREKSVRVVPDPESEVGCAVQLDADNTDGLDLPHCTCIYDYTTKRNVLEKEFEKPLSDKGYAWYDVGETVIPSNSIMVITKSWHVTIRIARRSELHGRRCRIYVSAKFTGPKYIPGSKGTSHIWLDRVVMVECEEPRDTEKTVKVTSEAKGAKP